MNAKIEELLSEMRPEHRNNDEAAACAAWFERCGETLSKEHLEGWLFQAATLAAQYNKGAPPEGRFENAW